MPNNPTSVTLDVRASSSNGGGWVNVNAANGAPYSYLYAGGNEPANNGNIGFGTGGGNAAVTLGFASSTDPRFQFVGDAVTFQNDSGGQLSTHGNASRTRVINDSCVAELNGSYKVVVTDTAANTTIACDPVITNRPGLAS